MRSYCAWRVNISRRKAGTTIKQIHLSQSDRARGEGCWKSSNGADHMGAAAGSERISQRGPAIILTPTDQIDDRKPMVVMCITTTFPDPPHANHLPLPWNSNPRQVATGLARRSAAVLDWLDTLYPDE